MEIKGLQGKEICTIIRACATSGVSELEIGNFKVKFGTHILAPVGIQAPNEGTHSILPKSGKAAEQVQQEIVEQNLDYLQQRATEDLAQTQTLIDDPAGFESSLLDDMLFDKGTEYEDSKKPGRARDFL